MFGQYPTPRRSGDSTPRLPPISSPSMLNDQSALALLDMQSITDERRARQMLEEQIRVITMVCKKLNQDIEALDSQMNDRNISLSTLELKNNELQTNSISLNKELQFKLARHDALLNKLETDSATIGSLLRDVQSRQNDGSRTLMIRINEIENRINQLNSKFDSIMMEQNVVLKNVEGDTVKQLQLFDNRTRTMLEDIRDQVYQNKSAHDTEMNKLESRLGLRMEEAARNADKYDRIDRKFEEYSQSLNKRLMSLEDQLQRDLLKIKDSNEKLTIKVDKNIEERFVKFSADQERVKRDMNKGFRDLEDALRSIEGILEGKIKLAEERLDKEIEKLRKTVVLM